MAKLVQTRRHNQIIHFKDGNKRTLMNVVKVWENTFTHVLLDDGREWIINRDNVLAVEVEWLD